MKKIVLFILFLALACPVLQAQNVKPFPIPSYNIPVDSGYVRFSEGSSASNPDVILEKRNVHIVTTSRNPENPNCQATIWVYSLDEQDILGPFTVSCGDELVVEIDERPWGVAVASESQIEVDVWIE